MHTSVTQWRAIVTQCTPKLPNGNVKRLNAYLSYSMALKRVVESSSVMEKHIIVAWGHGNVLLYRVWPWKGKAYHRPAR